MKEKQHSDFASPVYKKRFRRTTTQRPFKFVRNIESQGTAKTQVVEQVGSRGVVISSPVNLSEHGVSITDIVQQSPVPVIISCGVEYDKESNKADSNGDASNASTPRRRTDAGSVSTPQTRAEADGVSTPRRSQRSHQASLGFLSRLQYPLKTHQLTKFHFTSDMLHAGSQPDSNIDEEVHLMDSEHAAKHHRSLRQSGKSSVQKVTTGKSAFDDKAASSRCQTSTTADPSAEEMYSPISNSDTEKSVDKRTSMRRPPPAEGSTAKYTSSTSTVAFGKKVASITKLDTSAPAVAASVTSQSPDHTERLNTSKKTRSAAQPFDSISRSSRRLSLTGKSTGEDDNTETDDKEDSNSHISMATDKSDCVWRDESPSGTGRVRVRIAPGSLAGDVGHAGRRGQGKRHKRVAIPKAHSTPCKDNKFVSKGKKQLASVTEKTDIFLEGRSADDAEKPEGGFLKISGRTSHQASHMRSAMAKSSMTILADRKKRQVSAASHQKEKQARLNISNRRSQKATRQEKTLTSISSASKSQSSSLGRRKRKHSIMSDDDVLSSTRQKNVHNDHSKSMQHENSASCSNLQKVPRSTNRYMLQSDTTWSSVYDDETFGEHTDPELNASDKLTRSNKAQQWVQRQQLAKVHKIQGDSITNMLAETEAQVISSDLMYPLAERTIHKAFNFVRGQMQQMILQQKETQQLKVHVNKLKAQVKGLSQTSRESHQLKFQLLKELQTLQTDGLDADAIQIESWLKDFQHFRLKCFGLSE
ncbi:uncharacterized protein LOC112566358 isoform X3 [Pomacea canaliculata]|uniref:uncharacterized protein LOC112566358 isoform X3 n=1 Tax=Pomacea canaliculata TaxID=400727 RepID=UPI000D72A551|nr:uncharacterized protein LOC112566358 isoform X3 [Pomacea canaliculata]